MVFLKEDRQSGSGGTSEEQTAPVSVSLPRLPREGIYSESPELTWLLHRSAPGTLMSGSGFHLRTLWELELAFLDLSPTRLPL